MELHEEQLGPEDPQANGELMQVVSFRLGAEDYAVAIVTVKEIILFGGITAVSQMPACILGVINLRGQVIPVVDLRVRLGLTVGPLDELSRIMIARLEERVVGLVVDSVSQVMKIPTAAIQPAPELISGPAQRFISGIARLEQGMIICLDMPKILDREDLARLEDATHAEELATI